MSGTKGALLALLLLALMLGLPLGLTVWSGGLDHKREAAAHQEGYDAGRAHIPVEACPEISPDRVRAWKLGWIEGRKEATP
jgi:ribosome modulation factor